MYTVQDEKIAGSRGAPELIGTGFLLVDLLTRQKSLLASGVSLADEDITAESCTWYLRKGGMYLSASGH
jgi:hypothetical protein